MKIAAPVSTLEETDMLLHFGADELYCGIHTPEWQAHFGNHFWINRRDPVRANIVSWQQLKLITEKAHNRDVKVYLTLNAPFYPEGSMRYLLKLSEKLVSDSHVDGLIVSDLNLLIRLSRESLPIRLHLSSLGSCFNAQSIDYYLSLGVKRIILPRQLKLSEIQRLITSSDRQMEFEVFALNDGCYFEEGFCQTSHAFVPFCLSDWRAEQVCSEENRIPEEEIRSRFQDLQEYLRYLNNCGSTFQEDGLPNGPCSLCWFGYFRNWGVTAVKIVGREASFYRKMRSLQLVKAVMEDVISGQPPEKIAEKARSLRRTPEYCEKGYMCYFRG